MWKHATAVRHPPISSRVVSAPAYHQNFIFRFLDRLNTWVCRLMYGVRSSEESTVPTKGPALIVCDHTALGDPLVLAATAGRPIQFLMAKEIYELPHIRWAFKAFGCIPVQRGKRDVAAIRSMLDGLAADNVIGLFPEGGLDRHRLEEGHPGIAYLAIKSGAPVIPASIVWKGPHSIDSMLKTLFVPSKAVIRYGKPLYFPQESKPSKELLQSCTKEIMQQIESLREEILSSVS